MIDLLQEILARVKAQEAMIMSLINMKLSAEEKADLLKRSKEYSEFIKDK